MCGTVRSRRLTRWRTLAFFLRGEIRALAEDGFLELLLNTTRLEEITVPMIFGVLWLPSLKRVVKAEPLFLSFEICGLALGVDFETP